MQKNTSAEEQKNIEGIITDLMRELDLLAPHPDLLPSCVAANTNIALGEKNVISPAFNLNTINAALMNAYLCDLPKRKGLERWISHYRRRLHALRKTATRSAFALAA